MSRKSKPLIKTAGTNGSSSSVRRSNTDVSSSPAVVLDVKNLSNISTNVFDCCCFLFYCAKHEQVLLTKGNMKFFPHAQLNPAKTWFECSIEAALQILIGGVSAEQSTRLQLNLPFIRFMLIHLFRFQLPQSQRFITRLTYLVELNPDSEIPCCKSTSASGMRWYNLADVSSSKVENLWGPEVSFFTSTIKSNNKIENPQVEYSLTDAFKYIMVDRPDDEKQFSAMLINLTVNDIERLFADFIEHAFPSFFMTRESFMYYMQRHDIETRTKVIYRYFCTFRLRGKQYMQFTELLLGLASIDTRTPHADARVKYVFRYYDKDRDGGLNFAEFKRLLRHIKPKASDREVRDEMAKIGTSTVAGSPVVPFDCFKKAIGSHAFRGTSRLCRSKVSPFAQITRSLAARKLGKTMDANLRLVLQNHHYPGRCAQCSTQPSYELACNMVTLSDKGRFIKSKQILPSTQQRHSLDVAFNTDSVLHYLHNKIRKFNRHKGTPKNFRGLFANKASNIKELFFQDIKHICTDAARLVEGEERVLKIADPCYVIGDIHGNIEDLLTLETTLWRSLPLLTSNYLFLGDFVDRGKWGFECFLYLIIMKLRCPNKVFLLRGNHEVRAIQMKYSFHKELIKKYGQQHGQGIFDLFNHVFDRLPCCAVINQSIFAAHGGIPCSIIDLEELSKSTPHCVQNPEVEAVAVWEILWSDPLEYARFEETASMQGLRLSNSDASFMYLPNMKRGTSYLFSEYALFAFLKQNYLQYMVRAHEVPVDGFKFNFGRVCTTVFSCSHYCRNNNEAAVMLVEREGRLRLLRIDTTNNNPAMDT